MNFRWIGLPLLALCLLLPNFACGKRDKPTENEKDVERPLEIIEAKHDNSLPGEEGIKNAVRGYVQTVIDANLSDRHIKIIRKYATEKETKRVFIFIKADRDRGIALYTKLNKLTFDNISTSKDANFVDTSEHWEFQYLEIKTSKPTAPVKSIRYKLRYHLIKEEDRWIISELEEREKALAGEFVPPRWEMY